MKIGIPVSNSKTQYYINMAYSDYVSAVSGLSPVLIVPTMNLESVVDSIDGLILPGGIDVDPIYYMYDNSSSYGVDPEKDAFERSLFHMCKTLGKPIFGICRGFQLIIREYLLENEATEEFLDFREHVSRHNQVDPQRLERGVHQHFVEYIPRMLYNSDIHNVEHMPVNSMHHQCLVIKDNTKSIGGFTTIAWTKRGLEAEKTPVSICEAFRITDWGARILAVQWHPEELKDTALIENFFNHAKKPKPDALAKIA